MYNNIRYNITSNAEFDNSEELFRGRLRRKIIRRKKSVLKYHRRAFFRQIYKRRVRIPIKQRTAARDTFTDFEFLKRIILLYKDSL